MEVKLLLLIICFAVFADFSKGGQSNCRGTCRGYRRCRPGYTCANGRCCRIGYTPPPPPVHDICKPGYTYLGRCKYGKCDYGAIFYKDKCYKWKTTSKPQTHVLRGCPRGYVPLGRCYNGKCLWGEICHNNKLCCKYKPYAHPICTYGYEDFGECIFGQCPYGGTFIDYRCCKTRP